MTWLEVWAAALPFADEGSGDVARNKGRAGPKYDLLLGMANVVAKSIGISNAFGGFDQVAVTSPIWAVSTARLPAVAGSSGDCTAGGTPLIEGSVKLTGFRADFTLEVKESVSTEFILEYTHGAGLQLCVSILELPRHGNLSQKVGATLQQITSVPFAMSRNFSAALVYSPTPGYADGDAVVYSVSDGRTASQSRAFRFVFLKVDDVPIVQAMSLEVEEDSKEGTPPFSPAGLDSDSPFPTMLITTLPKKGRLYARDGTQITDTFLATRIAPPLPAMYAQQVTNVSTFWPAGPNTGEVLCPPDVPFNSSASCGYPKFHPMQILGPPRLEGYGSIRRYGDSSYAWCPSSKEGKAGLTKEGDSYLRFEWNPNATFEQYGYTEFIELRFETKSYVQRVEVGEPRGTAYRPSSDDPLFDALCALQEWPRS